MDGNTLPKLTESMVGRLLPTMKLQVQFLELQKSLSSNDSQTSVPLPSTSSATGTTASEQNGYVAKFIKLIVTK